MSDGIIVSAAPPADPRREALRTFLAAHPPKVSGTGTVTHPPGAADLVRREIHACRCGRRRAELEAVLRDLERE